MKIIFFDIVKKNKFIFVCLTLISLIVTLIGVLLPFLNGKFIDYLTIGVKYKVIFNMCILILGLGLTNVILYYISQILNTKVKLNASFDMKLRIIEHLRKIPITTYQKYNPSYLNQRTEQDINEIVTFIISNYAIAFINAAQIVILLIIIFMINSNIAILMLIFLPVYFFIYFGIRKPLYEKNYAAKESQNSYYNVLNEQFTFMEDIKINGNDYFNNKFVEKSYKRYEYDYMNYTRISGKFLSLDGIVSAIFQVITFLYGGWQTLDGKMSVGELTVICTYFSSSLQIIKYYFEFGKSYQNVKTSLNRLKELWSIECEKDGNKVINSIAKVDGLISFGYSKNKKILDDFVVKLEKGKIYGVVGQNGSGKSTLSKLLIGLLHTNSIHINDIDISNVNMKLLRLNNLLYIPQTLNYPNRTIQEIYQECTDNINIETLINNIKKIHLSRESNIINLLRNNWEHNINKLSGGEKQIISILKTMVKKFDFVILDEPSSNLDSNRATVLTEILEYLKKEEKIILIITHDLNIENKCDIKLHLTKLEERSDIQSINTNI